MPRPYGRGYSGTASPGYTVKGSRPKLTIHAQYSQLVLETLATLRQSIQSTITRQALNKALTPVVKALKQNTPSSKENVVVDKYGNPRPHLRDTATKKIGRFKDGNGYYGIVGFTHQKNAAHDWLVDKGTTLRFRKRIGGKYAFVELRWDQRAREGRPVTENLKKHKRRTELSKAHNMIETTLYQMKDEFARIFMSEFSSKVINKIR